MITGTTSFPIPSAGMRAIRYLEEEEEEERPLAQILDSITFLFSSSSGSLLYSLFLLVT